MACPIWRVCRYHVDCSIWQKGYTDCYYLKHEIMYWLESRAVDAIALVAGFVIGLFVIGLFAGWVACV